MPKYQLTGVSVGPWSVGVQWQPGPDDEDIVTELIDMLEDKRLLFELSTRERADHCSASASYIRTYINTLMKTPKISKELKSELKTLQGHFRHFMTNLSTHGLDHRGFVDPRELDRVLSWLREPVGQQIGLLAARYDIEVSDELAVIVPDENAWFFAAV